MSQIEKTCYRCGSRIAANARSCPECGTVFVSEQRTIEAEQKPPQATEEKVSVPVSKTPTESSPSTQRSPSRAPVKTCPQCGEKIPIRSVRCASCGHSFLLKSESGTQPRSVPISRSKPEKKRKSRGDSPFKALLILSICIAVYAAVLVVVMAIVYRYVDGSSFSVISTCTWAVSLLLAFVFGSVIEDSYGESSTFAAYLYAFVVIVGFVAFDYFIVRYADMHFTSKAAWGIAALGISVSINAVASIVIMINELKETYCPHCQMTHMVYFSHDKNQQEIYGYKYKTHEAKTKTAIVKNHPWEHSAEIEYTAPAYQENLGLHKTTTKDDVYVCKRCGYINVKKTSKTEKVEM